MDCVGRANGHLGLFTIYLLECLPRVEPYFIRPDANNCPIPLVKGLCQLGRAAVAHMDCLPDIGEGRKFRPGYSGQRMKNESVNGRNGKTEKGELKGATQEPESQADRCFHFCVAVQCRAGLDEALATLPGAEHGQ